MCLLLQGNKDTVGSMYLKIFSLGSLKSTRRHSFKPEISLIPNALFAVSQIKSENDLKNTEYEGVWHIEVSSLFHSQLSEAKKN